MSAHDPADATGDPDATSSGTSSSDAGAPGVDEPASRTGPAARPTRSPKRGMCAAVLFLESITLGLTTPVMITLAGVGVATALVVGLGLAVLCVLLSGLLRYSWAYTVGWLVQVAAVGLGFVVPVMFFLGAVFAALWAGAVYLGTRIERERAAAYDAWDAAHPDGG